MRFYALAATLVLVAGLSACSKSGSDQSSSTATTAPDAAATAAADTGGAAATDAPKDGGSVAGADVYPGATLKAGGTSSNGSMGTAAGKVYVTDDSYDKVTAWYKDHMPADAHMTHMSAAGSNSTVYVKGLGTSNQETLSISSSPATQGKTWITVAQLKK